MAFLAGYQSQQIAEASTHEINDWIGASSFGENLKSTLVSNVREADRRIQQAKESFGNGISVKAMVLNVSKCHSLRLDRKACELGKPWNDRKVLSPMAKANPLEAVPIFHGKVDFNVFSVVDGMKGCRAGLVYSIIDDSNGQEKGKVSLAWENPYKQTYDSNNLAVACFVSKYEDKLDAVLRWCENHTGEHNNGQIEGNNTQENPSISASIVAQSETTSYILFVIKIDDGFLQYLPNN